MAYTPFQKRVKYIQKKYHLERSKIMRLLEISKATMSKCMNKIDGYTGDKFIEKLDIIIYVLDGKYDNDDNELQQIEQEIQNKVWICPRCKEPQEGPPCKNRSCKKSPYYQSDITVAGNVSVLKDDNEEEDDIE